MKNRSIARLAAGLSGALVLAGLTVGGPAPSAQAAQGNRPLVKVLGADGVEFDRKFRDFDIVEAAVLAVLEEKPDSPLGLITKGRQRLTVFLPTDGAFRRLVTDLTGRKVKPEQHVFARVAKAAGDIDTLEAILLYHVVAGQTLNSPQVLAAAAENTTVTTAQGGTWRVRIDEDRVRLVDADRNDLDPRAIGDLLDINRGNKQVAHGINRVLRPIDL